MKYYTIGLHDVKYTEYYSESYNGQMVYVDEIIVKKGLRYATELLTGQKIEILPKGSYDKYGVLDYKYTDEAQFQETGYHLVVLEEDFIPTNLTTIEDRNTYVENFKRSNYCEIYAEIKEKTQRQNSNENMSLKQKIKMVRETKNKVIG